MVIELKDNGDIDVSKLTEDELEALVDIKLDIYSSELKGITSGEINELG